MLDFLVGDSESNRESEQDRVICFRDACATIFKRGNFAEALQLAEKALAYFADREERSGEGAALYQIGAAYRSLADFPASRAAIQRAITIYEELEDDEGLCNAVNAMGLTYKYSNSYRDAVACFQRSLDLAQKIGDIADETNALANLGTLYYQMGDSATALELLHRCLPLYEEQGNERLSAIVLLNIGINHVARNEPQAAIPALQQGRVILERLEDRYHLASLLDVLGAAYIDTEQYEIGLAHLHQALTLFEALGMPALIAMTLSRIGGTLLTQQRYEEALPILERSREINGKEGNEEHYCENLFRLGSLHATPSFSGYDEESALRLLKEAQSVGEKLGTPRSLRPIYNQLSEIYERQGNMTEALIFHRLMFQAEKRLFNTESEERIRNLQVRFEVSQAQQAAEIARRDAEIAHLRTVELAEALHATEELRALADKRADYNSRIATTLQEAVVPTLSDRVAPGLTIRSFYYPASDEAAIGGDFYDVFSPSAGKTMLVVGDVIGHGLEAALSISEVRFALRAFLSLDTGLDLGAALGQLNDFLVKTSEQQRIQEGSAYRNRLVALTLAMIDPVAGELHLVSAGMEPALVIRAETGRAEYVDAGDEYVDAGDMVLGAISHLDYQAQRLRFAQGDMLAITTDGITEAFGSGGKIQFGSAGLEQSLRAALARENKAATDVQQIGESALSSVRDFVGGAFRDDVCLLLARLAT